jgi:hypothetical protein
LPFPHGPQNGTELPPTTAPCPATGPDTEAYDGGAIIQTANPQKPGTATGDVVGLETSFPGIADGQALVDPIPNGSNEAANAWEVQAVITLIHDNDTVTVTPYVVCGP